MIKNNMRKLICFTGGGTAGHVAPGCAVIEILRVKTDYDFLWIGSKAEIDREIPERFGIKYKTIPAGKFRRYFSIRNFFDLFRIFSGFIVSFFLLAARKPCLIFSKGGYVSFPPLLAAKILKIPVISHESDLVPGLATRLNAPLSCSIITSYPESKSYFSSKYHKRIITLGNPIRREFFKYDPEYLENKLGIKLDRPVILVVGGSLGAMQLNELVSSTIKKLVAEYIVIHQCGKNYKPEFTHRNYICRPYFSEEYSHLLNSSDIVVSRAGASSLWEIITLRKPAILIPLGADVSRGDQLDNAEYFRKKNAVIVMINPDPSEFYRQLTDILTDKKKLSFLSDNLSNISLGNPAEKISRFIIKFLNGAGDEYITT